MKEAHAAGSLIIAEDSIEGYQVATVFFSSFRYGIAIEQVSPALRGDLVGVKRSVSRTTWNRSRPMAGFGASHARLSTIVPARDRGKH
jgi:hypothetical protein